MRFVVALAPLALATGCLIPTYIQHRAAFVPHSTPVLTDGQPLDQAAQIAFGASNIADPVAPTAGSPNVGTAVPGTQLRGELALRVGDRGSVWVAGEQGLASTAHPVTSTQPPIDNGDVIGAGGGMSFYIHDRAFHPEFSIAVSAEFLFWSVPWVQYTSCVQNCNGPGFTFSDKGTDLEPTIAFDVTPSYRIGAFTVFAGVTFRNQPSIDEKETTNEAGDPDVNPGPYNVTLHAGLEWEIVHALKLMLSVQQTVTTDPIDYGPGFAFMIRTPFGG
jgi:hypothetical protein